MHNNHSTTSINNVQASADCGAAGQIIISCHLLSDPRWTGRSRWRRPPARSLSCTVEAAAQLDTFTFASVSTLSYYTHHQPFSTCPPPTARPPLAIIDTATTSVTIYRQHHLHRLRPLTCREPALASPSPVACSQRSLHLRSYRGITSQAPSFLPTLRGRERQTRLPTTISSHRLCTYTTLPLPRSHSIPCSSSFQALHTSACRSRSL